jgi:hypothetical protein
MGLRGVKALKKREIPGLRVTKWRSNGGLAERIGVRGHL